MDSLCVERQNVLIAWSGVTKKRCNAKGFATINVVDFSDVTRCQNMVDVSDNVSEQARKGFLSL